MARPLPLHFALLVFTGWVSRQEAITYFAHYNAERNHQARGKELIDPDPALQGGAGEIACSERLGGLLRFYHRAAA